MKFQANGKELAATLSKVSGCLPARSPMPVLECIALRLSGDQLMLSATDMNVSIDSVLTVRSQQDGEILLPGKRFIETIKGFRDNDFSFTLDAKNNRVTFASASGKYKLSGLAITDFPKLPEFTAKHSFAVSLKSFIENSNTVKFAVSDAAHLPQMQGVCLEFKSAGVTYVATDGFRLARVIDTDAVKSKKPASVIIPMDALELALKALSSLDIEIELSAGAIRFTDEFTAIWARTIDEKYPDYEKIIPTNHDKKAVIRRADLIQVTKQCSVYANEQTRQVRLALSDELCTMKSTDVDSGADAEETLPCTFEGDEFEIGLNAKFFLESLSKITTDEALLTFSTPLQPIMFYPYGGSENQTTMLLIPIRLNA